jgi:hypothetical protein
MKDGKMVRIDQLLLESRTCAYVEWLANEVIMTTNKLDFKDKLLVMLSTKHKKHTSHIVYHILESREIIPTSRVSLASTLCTQGLFYPVAGAA